LSHLDTFFSCRCD